jgi:hypothetical protein
MSEEKPISPEAETELRTLVLAGQTIQAIKRYRELAGCGLAEAHAWVEGLRFEHFPRRPTVPCPYCGESLRTDVARQCVSCGMDWHNPDHVVKLGRVASPES